jgi:DNA uptake protein ComE-like DNA-binding protein
MWKNFFYLSLREKQGILMLICVLAGVFIGRYLFAANADDAEVSGGAENTATVKQAEAPVYSSVYERGKNNRTRQPQEEKRTYYRQQEDPNASSPAYHYPKKEKFAAGTVIELNAADTVLLMKIPGVGSSFARRITGYRNLLGGYYRLQQLQEVYGMYEELYEKITPYLRVDTALIRTMALDSLSIGEIKMHPYFNFYQAKAIVELRKKKGKVGSIDELAALKEFTPADIERIRRYVRFSTQHRLLMIIR